MSSQGGLYKSLGVDPECSGEELTAAFRKLALRFHPDKNPGQEDKFREVSRAYKILSDYESRKIYDVAGEEALRSRYDGGDPFSNAHYSWADVEGLFRHHVIRRRGPDVREDLEVTLEDLCCGALKNVTLMKYILCPQCKVNIRDCYDCNGSGHIGGIGCESCSSRGYVDANGPNVCSLCKGDRVVSFMTTYKINIRPGMYGGQYIPFVSEGNEEPGCDPGDRVFILKTKEHPNFERINMQDLAMETVITSRQKHQPGGSIVKIPTLDGRILDVALHQGIRNGTVVEIPGEGLPDYFIPSKKGKLIITVRKVKNTPEPVTPAKNHDARVKRSNSLGRYFFPGKGPRTPKNEALPDDHWKPVRDPRQELASPDLSPAAISPSRKPKVKRASSFGPFGPLQMRSTRKSYNREHRKSFPPGTPSSWFLESVQPQKVSSPYSMEPEVPSSQKSPSSSETSRPVNPPPPQQLSTPEVPQPVSPTPQPYVQTSPLAEGVKPELVVYSQPDVTPPIRKGFWQTSKMRNPLSRQSKQSQPSEMAYQDVNIMPQTEETLQPLTKSSPPKAVHQEMPELSAPLPMEERIPDDPEVEILLETSLPPLPPPETTTMTTLPESSLSLPPPPSPQETSRQEETVPEPVGIDPFPPINPRVQAPPALRPIDTSEPDTNSIESRDYEFSSINDRATVRVDDICIEKRRVPIKKGGSFKISFRKKKTPPRPLSDNTIGLAEPKEQKSSSTSKKRISHGPLTSFFFRK